MLAIFVLSLSVVLLAAALAFDTGSILLARRDQQNAADAAAMGGARYIVDNETLAISSARQIADFNGFTQGGGSASTQWVDVNVPPREGQFAGFDNAIEVKIGDTRPSIFASIASIFGWEVSARAVAAQLDGVTAPWSILALDPDACPGLKVTGKGYVDSAGTIHVNATCEMGIQRQGPGTVTVSAEGGCSVVGGFQDGGGPGELYCGPGDEPKPPQTGAGHLNDPLVDIPPPCGEPWPVGDSDAVTYPDITSLCSVSDTDYPVPPEQVLLPGEEAMEIPSGCPGGSSAATLDSPSVCQFNSSYADSRWYLSPGIYPGGIKLQGGTFYLLPGIYYLGGGGLDITGTGTYTYSVASDRTIPATDLNGAPVDSDTDGIPDVHGGVLLFNTQLPNGELPDAAQSDLGPIGSNGSSAKIYLAPLSVPKGDDDYPLDRLVIYQDRRYQLDGDYEVTLNGSSSNSVVRGVVYVPTGNVRLNGNGGTLTIDQVIAADYVMNGDSGTIKALNGEDETKPYFAAGLIE